MGVWAQKEQRSLCIGQSDERGQQYNTVDFHDYRIAKEGLAPHERLPEILVVPREKTPTGAAARGNP